MAHGRDAVLGRASLASSKHRGTNPRNEMQYDFLCFALVLPLSDLFVSLPVSLTLNSTRIVEAMQSSYPSETNKSNVFIHIIYLPTYLPPRFSHPIPRDLLGFDVDLRPDVDDRGLDERERSR